MGHPVVHWELWSKDPERLSEFYARVFGWQIEHIPQLNYRFVRTGGNGGIDGGIMQPKEGRWPGSLALYVDVEDLDSSARAIVEAGGLVIVERAEVPGMGAYALFSDPDDRVFGIWQRAK
jgi:predicted enzyme related to lactoylglutathione lyase